MTTLDRYVSPQCYEAACSGCPHPDVCSHPCHVEQAVRTHPCHVEQAVRTTVHSGTVPLDACAPCQDAIHPAEHRACSAPETCSCHCRQARVAPAQIKRDDTHSPMRMLDLSEVTEGCWVEWRGAEEADSAGPGGRGGVVVGIDRLPDRETGEMVRIFRTAKTGRGGIRWDTLAEDQVGIVDLPRADLVRSLHRAMAGEVSRRRGAVQPDERRLCETLNRLARSA